MIRALAALPIKATKIHLLIRTLPGFETLAGLSSSDKLHIMTIRKNLDDMERAIRIILGIVLLVLVALRFVGPRTSWAYLGFIGIIPFITGSIGY